MNPTMPNETKIARHDMKGRSAKTRNGVIPPAKCDAAKKDPWTRPRAERGIHREKVRAIPGHAPASPTPKRKRAASSEGYPRAAPVATMNADHQTTIRVIMALAPLRSIIHAAGIPKAAYASAKALKTKPIW